MQLSEILEQFGKKIGLELALDENGLCRVSIDEMTISIQEIPEADVVALYADVGELPVEGREDFYAAALKANWMFSGTGGSTLAIDPQSDKVILNRCDSLASLDVEGFSSTLERFVNMLETWMKIAKDFGPVAIMRAKESEAERAEAPSFGDSGFVRI